MRLRCLTGCGIIVPNIAVQVPGCCEICFEEGQRLQLERTVIGNTDNEPMQNAGALTNVLAEETSNIKSML